MDEIHSVGGGKLEMVSIDNTFEKFCCKGQERNRTIAGR